MGALDPLAKLMMGLGILLFLAGLFWQLGWLQAIRWGRLPGDIYIRREGLQIYIPLTTGILVSGFLTLVAWLLRR
jgi:hypothetical protein